MKKVNYIFRLIPLVVVLLLISFFANNRNNEREIVSESVNFDTDDALYISKNLVNKMLKESMLNEQTFNKEMIDLKEVEERIESEKFVDKANVYLSVDSGVRVDIEQRKPILRVFNNVPFYLDASGFEMPISLQHSARVPVVFNFTEKHKNDLVKLVNFIRRDQFLKQLVVSVDCKLKNEFLFKIRDENFSVKLGSIDNLELKFKNFKAFYVKAKKDKLFTKYSSVNLEITNQVICTRI